MHSINLQGIIRGQAQEGIKNTSDRGEEIIISCCLRQTSNSDIIAKIKEKTALYNK